jgi:hypothetical protein
VVVVVVVVVAVAVVVVVVVAVAVVVVASRSWRRSITNFRGAVLSTAPQKSRLEISLAVVARPCTTWIAHDASRSQPIVDVDPADAQR